MLKPSLVSSMTHAEAIISQLNAVLAHLASISSCRCVNQLVIVAQHATAHSKAASMAQLSLLRAGVITQENSAPQVVGLESHVYLRALPVALYLLFPSEEGKVGLEAIGSRQMQRGLKLLKQKPVVPAIGDLPLLLMHLLHQLSPFLVAHGVCLLTSLTVMHNSAKLLALAAALSNAPHTSSSPASALRSCVCGSRVSGTGLVSVAGP